MKRRWAPTKVGAHLVNQSLPEPPPKRAALQPAQMAWEGMASPGLRQSGSFERPLRGRLRLSRLSSWCDLLAASLWGCCWCCGCERVRWAWGTGGATGAEAAGWGASSTGAGGAAAVTSCSASGRWPFGSVCSALRVLPLPPLRPRLRLRARASSSEAACAATVSPPRAADEIVSTGKPQKSGRTPLKRKRPVLL